MKTGFLSNFLVLVKPVGFIQCITTGTLLNLTTIRFYELVKLYSIGRPELAGG